MKKFKQLFTLLAIIMLTCIMPLTVSAISFSMQSADEFYLQIPGPVKYAVPDTDVSHAIAVVEYGNVIPSDEYRIKSIQWKRAYTGEIAQEFSDVQYAAIVILETTDGDFWNIPSSYLATINGVKATVENQGDGTLKIYAGIKTLPAIELKDYRVDNHYEHIDNDYSAKGFIDHEISLEFVFPTTLKNGGYTFRIDYREEYFLKGKDKPYTTFYRDYAFTDLIEDTDGTYRMKAKNVGDQQGRSMKFYADVYLIPPEGKGKEVLTRTVSSEIFFDELKPGDLWCTHLLNPGGMVSKYIYTPTFEKGALGRDPYFYDGLTIYWRSPSSSYMNTANSGSNKEGGYMRFLIRVFVNDEEVKTVTESVYQSEGDYYGHSTSLHEPLIGNPGEIKNIRAEVYGYYPKNADDGNKETAPIRTFEWELVYSETFKAGHDYIEGVSVNGIEIEKDTEDDAHPYKSTVQAYLPQEVSFDLEFPGSYDMDTSVIDVRVFIKQELTDSAEGLSDSALGAGYREITEADCVLLSGNTYRYTTNVYGRDGVTNAPVTLEVWVFSKLGQPVERIDFHTVYLTFEDEQDLFAIKVDADGKENCQSFLSVQLQRWDGYDDEMYTTAHQNGVGALLTTDSILPFEMQFIYRVPGSFPEAYTEMRYALEPKLYYRNSIDQAWTEYEAYSELKKIDENRYKVFFNLQETYVTGRRMYRLDLNIKTPYGTVTDTKIPYSFYINVDFNSNNANLAKGVIVNDTEYSENDPTVHLDVKVPKLQFRYYLPHTLYDAGYRIVMKETFGGVTKYYYPSSANYPGLKYTDDGYGYQTYTYQTKLTASAGGTIKPQLEMLLWKIGSSSMEKSVGTFTPTLKYDATPVFVCGIELKDGQYIKGGGDQTVYTGTPDPNNPGRDGYAYNNGGTLTLNKFFAMKINPIGNDPDYYEYAYIYKKDQGDLRIKLIGSSTLTSIKTNQIGYGIYVRNGDLIIEGTSSDRLQIQLRDEDGEYDGSQDGIRLVKGSMTLRGATLSISAGKGINVNSNDGKFTMETFEIVTDSGETVSYSPNLGIKASSVGLYVLETTNIDILGGTFSITALDYDGQVSNVDAIQYKQTNYTDGYSTILAGDGTSEWIYDMNTTYTGAEGDSVYEIDGTVLKSLRLVKGAGCIVIGDIVLEDGDYLYYQNGEPVVSYSLPTEDWDSYAYNDNGDLTLQNFTYNGYGYITDRPTNPVGHMPDLTFIIKLVGTNSITNTGKSYGKAWEDFCGSYGIIAQNDLRFTGEGNLTITGECGILFFDNMDVYGGDISINASKVGVYINGDKDAYDTTNYTHPNRLRLSGGDLSVVIGSKGNYAYAINGHGMLQPVKGTLIADASSGWNSTAVHTYGSSAWYVLVDVRETDILKTWAGSNTDNVDTMSYATNEEISNSIGYYPYVKMTSYGEELIIPVTGYSVGNPCTAVKGSLPENPYAITGMNVALQVVDNSGYSAFSGYMEGSTNYWLRVYLIYDEGTDPSEFADTVKVKITTANGEQVYKMERDGNFWAKENQPLYRVELDPPVGTCVDALSFELGGYVLGNTVGDVDVIELTEYLYDYNVGLYENYNGTGMLSVLMPGSELSSDLKYVACVNVTLKPGTYLSDTVTASNVKLNGIPAYEIDEISTKTVSGKQVQTAKIYFSLPQPEGSVTPPGSGVTVSGTVTSYLSDTETITVQLFSGDTVVHETTCMGMSAVYSFNDVQTGTYILRVTKARHLIGEYTLSVDDSDLTQNVQLTLKGDINVDGQVNIEDALLLFKHSMMSALYPVDYSGNMDFTADGSLDIADSLILFQHSMLPDIYPI